MLYMLVVCKYYCSPSQKILLPALSGARSGQKYFLSGGEQKYSHTTFMFAKVFTNSIFRFM